MEQQCLPLKLLSFLFVFLMASVVLVEIHGVHNTEKVWPDYTCHSNFKANNEEIVHVVGEQGWPFRIAVEVAYEQFLPIWESCVHSEKETEICPKTCVIDSLGLITEQVQTDSMKSSPARVPAYNITVDVKAVRSFLVQALVMGHIESYKLEENKYLEKVDQEVEKCKNNHPEVKRMALDARCAKWEPFVSCIEKAIGCV